MPYWISNTVDAWFLFFCHLIFFQPLINSYHSSLGSKTRKSRGCCSVLSLFIVLWSMWMNNGFPKQPIQQTPPVQTVSIHMRTSHKGLACDHGGRFHFKVKTEVKLLNASTGRTKRQPHPKLDESVVHKKNWLKYYFHQTGFTSHFNKLF